MKRTIRSLLVAVGPFALMSCSQSGGPVARASAGPSPAAQDWLARAEAIVRASNDPDDVWDCEYLTELAVPDGWDGKLESMSSAGEDALSEMKFAAASVGGNFVLLILEQPPRGEAYLCTE